MRSYSPKEVIKILQLEDVQIEVPYKKMYITESLDCDAEQVIDILSQTQVYRRIFDRLLHGEGLLKDWFVMLGTLGKIEGNSNILCDVFRSEVKISVCYVYINVS